MSLCKANLNGATFEARIAELLCGCGFSQANNREIFASRTNLQPRYEQHAPAGLTIYGRNRFVDFLVTGARDYPQGLILECKWQSSAGSVDEKFPFLCANITKTRVPTVVLLDGGGYSPGAAAWLRSQSGSAPYLEAVLSTVEFEGWAKANLSPVQAPNDRVTSSLEVHT